MARHSFSGAAVATTLSSAVNSSVTTLPVNTLSGTWPNTSTGPFAIVLDRGTSSEEKCLVSAFTTNSMTVTRGYDGTSGVAHNNGATVEHCIDATTIDEHDNVVNGVGQGTPSNSAVGDVAADGSNTTQPAAGDHKHGRESFGTSSSNSAVTDTESAGSAVTPAHSDHVHGREGFGVPGNSAQNDTASAGTATTVAHSDHVHGRETVPYGRAAVFSGSQSILYNTAAQIAMSQQLAGHGMTFGSNVFTVPKAGIYRVSATVQGNNAGTNGNPQIYFTQNGSGISGGAAAQIFSSGLWMLNAEQLVQCAANDTIGLEGQNNLAPTGAWTVENAELDIEWVGPA